MALTKVSSSLVSDSAVTSGKIADGGVATADIATNAVTSTKIAQNSILTKHIDDGQVTTDQLGADAVTAAKIADDAISEEHLDVTVITSLSEVTAATGDLLMVADISDSNNLKKIPVSSILAGTLTTAAQTNITSVGTLTGLTVSGATNINDALTVKNNYNETKFIRNADTASSGAAGHYLSIGAITSGSIVTPNVIHGVTDTDGTSHSFAFMQDGANSLSFSASKNATFAGNITTAYTIDAGAYALGSTVVMNSNRDLTNIGTISSGAITSTGTLTVPGGTSGSRTIKDSYSNGALANQGTIRSSGGNYWGYGTYQDGSTNWKSAVSVALERSVFAIDEDTAYWSHAPSQTVSIGSDLTTQPTKKIIFDLENSKVGINTSTPTAYANSQATLYIEDTTSPAIAWSDSGQTRDWFAVAQGSGLYFIYADGGGSGNATNVNNVLTLDNSGSITAGSQITVSNGSATSTYGFRHEGADKFMRIGMPNASFAYFETDSTNGFYLDGNTTVNGSLLTKNSDAFSVAGIALRGDVADFIRSENSAINVNRLSNNGDQIRFHQAGTLIGSIGSEGGDSLYIQSDGTGGGGLRFHNNGGILPLRNGATVHNTIDLGSSTRAFKDFYTAGMASVGHVLPNSAGTYSVNHLGVYSSGITINAASSQTGWLMAAGNGKLSFASDGAKVGADGLGFHTTMNNRIETDQTTATRMKFYLHDTIAGEWKRTGSGGSIRPNQYSSGDTAANLPALASYDDENTGVYFPAADSIGISVGGSQAMLFDNDKFLTVGSESGVPNNLAGLQIKRGGLLINGTSNTTNFHTTAFLSNYWTYFGSSGASGSYSGSFRVSVPSPTGTAGNAWGGFQIEIYLAGYNGKFCHAMLSGYTNGGVTLSESTIIRSSGSHSVSYGAYHTGGNSNQGVYFDINIPGYTHPSAFYRITKGGDTSSDHETALGRDLVAAWS